MKSYLDEGFKTSPAYKRCCESQLVIRRRPNKDEINKQRQRESSRKKMQKILEIPELRRASSCVLCCVFKKNIPSDLSCFFAELSYVHVCIYRSCEPQRHKNIKARCDKLRRICANLMFPSGCWLKLSASSLEKCCVKLPDAVWA